MKRLLATTALFTLISAPFAMAAEITLTYSEDFAEALEDDYGIGEGDYLAGYVTEKIAESLDKAGKDVARIAVTINDAKPNKPTLQQLSDRPGLDYMRSISIGGMDVSAIAFDADGREIFSLSYDWFETDIRNVPPSTTWSDARRAARIFARRFAEGVPVEAAKTVGG